MEQSKDRIRVVVDTNLWISFLLGSNFENFLEIITSPKVESIMTEKLIDEVIEVTHREKFRKYFDLTEADALVAWLRTMTFVELRDIPIRCRDPKDDYLLELAVMSKSIYLVSGDKDLTSLGNIEGCKIMTVKQFVTEMSSIIY